jgi:hypothetical protein
MSSDTSSKAPIDPTDEVDKKKSSGKPEDMNKNGQHEEEEDELETTDDEMSFQEWKAWKKKKKLQRKKGKFNTKIVIESSDDSDTGYKKRSSSSSKVKKKEPTITEWVMTTPFKFQVNTMPQFTWESHLTLMARAIINGRQKCLVT